MLQAFFCGHKLIKRNFTILHAIPAFHSVLYFLIIINFYLFLNYFLFAWDSTFGCCIVQYSEYRFFASKKRTDYFQVLY